VSRFGIDLHGVGISIECDDEPLLEAFRARFRAFPRIAGTADIRIVVRIVPAGAAHAIERPAGPARPVYDPPEGSVLYLDDADVLFIELDDRLRVRCDPGSGSIEISARESMRGEHWLLSRPMITLPLVEALKRRGLYSVHAAGVDRDGRGIVLPGESGAGKSTLALALARRGLMFLSDDMVFLRRRADGEVQILAFPDEVDLTPTSASFFADLPSGFSAPPPDGWKKHRLGIGADAADAELPRPSAPGALVFPSPAAEETSSLTPMERSEALVSLAPNVLLTDAPSSQRHLDALGELTRRSACYRLRTGRDFDRVATLLAAAAA
jgi:HPr Serine kinase C-terminal domain